MEETIAQSNQPEVPTPAPPTAVPNSSTRKISNKRVIFGIVLIAVILASAYFILKSASVSPQGANSTINTGIASGSTKPPYQIFVPDFGSGNVSIINPLTYAVQNISTGGHPSFVIPIPGTGLVYVINYGTSESLSVNSSIQAVNLSRSSVIAKIQTVSPGAEISTRNGSLVYFVNGKNLSVISVLNVRNNSIIRNISIPNTRTNTIAFSNDYSQIYALSYDGNLTTVNTTTNKIMGSVSYPIFPAQHVAGGSEGKYIYVLGTGPEGVVTFISKFNYSTQGSVHLAAPIAMAQSPNGKLLYVVNGTKTLSGPAWAISAVSVSNKSIVKTVPINGTSVFYNQPSSISTSPDGNYLYIDTDSGNLLVINATSYAVIKTIKIGSFPSQISVG